MTDIPFFELDISVRTANVLTKNGCPWENIAGAKAFAAEAVKSGIVNSWYNCGRKTVAELREWSGLNEQTRIELAIELLKKHGFTVSLADRAHDRRSICHHSKNLSFRKQSSRNAPARQA
jgi:hypothetical protein